MKQTADIMGMPIAVELETGSLAPQASHGFEIVFNYFRYIDNKFSTYKSGSEISRINRGEIRPGEYSADMRQILELSDKTKTESGGYFDIKKPDGSLDPSGTVKGWAIYQAGKLLRGAGFETFFIAAGGDIQASAAKDSATKWRVGIRNPFKREENIKVLGVTNEGVATSGTYERGQHIYNPLSPNQPITEIVSMTVVGPDIYEADRFATAAFAMEKKGIEFIEKRAGLEGYMVDAGGTATMTSGFKKYVS